MSSSSNATTLTDLICNRLWRTLYFKLKEPNTRILIDDHVSNAITENAVVHLACRFQAPLKIIKLLSSRYPSSIHKADAAGRFPIHVATKWSAMPDVIQFLTSQNPSVVGMKDDFGKSPLHYLAESYLDNCDPYHICHAVDYMLEAVNIIKTCTPNAATIEDNDGMNAIEYAIEKEAPIDVVVTMQNSSRDYLREKRATREENRHVSSDFNHDIDQGHSMVQTSMVCPNFHTLKSKNLFTQGFDQHCNHKITVSSIIQAATSA